MLKALLTTSVSFLFLRKKVEKQISGYDYFEIVIFTKKSQSVYVRSSSLFVKCSPQV